MLRMKWLALGLALVVNTGCPGNDTGEGEGEDGGEGEEGVDKDSVIDEVADAIFAAEGCPNSAIGAILLLEPSAFSAEAFKENLRNRYTDAVIVVESQRAPCLAAIAACDLESEACEELFDGTRADGEGCASVDECVDDLACTAQDNQCGTCVAREAVGGTCAVIADCQDGLECGEDSTCVTALAANAACDPQDDLCGEDLQCRDDVCKPLRELGDACVVEVGCGFLTGLACVDSECVAVTVVQANGAACDASFNNPVRYCVDQLLGDNNCIDEDDDGVGVCVAGAAVGAACAATGCLLYASCEDNECVEFPGVGDACVFQCQRGLSCDNEVCVEDSDSQPVCAE